MFTKVAEGFIVSTGGKNASMHYQMFEVCARTSHSGDGDESFEGDAEQLAGEEESSSVGKVGLIVGNVHIVQGKTCHSYR